MSDQTRFTQVPNALLDHIADLSEAELRIMLVIIRKTAGYHKECDLISLTQFEQLTGLSRPSINATLKLLVTRGAVEHTGSGKRGVKCYRLSDELVNSVNQLSRATSKLSEPELVNSVNQTSPGLVNSVNTQKKDSKEKEIKGDARKRAATSPTQSNLDFAHEGVATYKRLSGRKPAPTMVKLIASKVSDMPRWEQAVENWIKAGFNPGNIGGMLDWYEHPDRITRKHANGRAAPEPARPIIPTTASSIAPDARSPEETARRARELMAARNQKAGQS